jgi:predicted nicotinamide N-methyase
VHLTDGNSGVVQLAEANIAANSIRASEVKAFVLPWKEVPPSIGRYDVILAADCLYFEKAHAGLLELLDSSLTVGGVAYFVCPPRGKSLHVFMDNLRRHSSGYAMDMHVAGWNSHIDAVIATVRAKQPELFDDNIHSLCILTVERLS